jgi:hypothetical protein
VRPDLSERRGLSKSLLSSFDLCAQKAWLTKWHRRPFIPSEKTTFGNAVDRGVQAIAEYHRMGRKPNMGRALRLAKLRAEESGPGLVTDYAEVQLALERFEADMAPQFDWSAVITQHHFHEDLPGIGEIDGHPDLIWPADEDTVGDVKTAGRMKDTARTIEAGVYTLCREQETGRPVREFVYLVWVRLKVPVWRIASTFIGDEFREWTRERIEAFVRADKLDDHVNERRVALGLEPENWTMPSGPKNGGLCRTCEHNPQLGGACRMAVLDPIQGGDE